MQTFDYERFEVYSIAIEFILLSEQVIRELPSGRGYLGEQLQRAASSITLNLAEGSGEFALAEKCRFYRMAKRSATECSAVYEILFRLTLIQEESYMQARLLLLRIVAMLTKLAQLVDRGH